MKMSRSLLRRGTGKAASLIGAASLAAALPLSAAIAALWLPGTAGAQPLPRTAGAQPLPRTAGQPGCCAPQGRVWTSWAYDGAHRDVVLFGGDRAYQSAGPDTVLGDTWTWDGTVWKKRHPAASPSPRTGAAMVYDSATRQLLLFGGSRHPFTQGGFLGDTWTWNGTTWTRLHPAASPAPRHNAGLVYDSTRREVILFGGYDGAYLNDTWAWNGSTWTLLHPATSPPPRDTHSLADDPATGSLILFGGFNGERLGDTWSWDSSTWTELHPASSPGVVSTAWQAAYDRASHQLVIFGGDGSGGVFSDATWSWDGTTWTMASPAAHPGHRAYGSLTYDQALHRLVLFGGGTGRTDPPYLWEWDGVTWQRP